MVSYFKELQDLFPNIHKFAKSGDYPRYLKSWTNCDAQLL